MLVIYHSARSCLRSVGDSFSCNILSESRMEKVKKFRKTNEGRARDVKSINFKFKKRNNKIY